MVQQPLTFIFADWGDEGRLPAAVAWKEAVARIGGSKADPAYGRAVTSLVNPAAWWQFYFKNSFSVTTRRAQSDICN
jgi:hypothetical protein